jgi:hypothetical protein
MSAEAIDCSFALLVDQVLQISGNRLDEHEALLAAEENLVLDVEPITVPDLLRRGPATEDATIIVDSGVEIANDDVNVAKLELHVHILTVLRCSRFTSSTQWSYARER